MSGGSRALGGRISSAIAGMHPGAFAFVMATGIISTALHLNGDPLASEVLMLVGFAGAVLLGACYVARLALHRREVVADVHRAERAFGFLTIPAGLDVLAARSFLANQPGLAAGLGVLGALSWLLLGYGIPVSLMLRGGDRSLVSAINGSWFLWVVSTQSVSVVCSLLTRMLHGAEAALASVAVGLWGVGVVLYLMLVGLVTLRLLASSVTPHALSPTYWIYMGATAITALAGADVLELPRRYGMVEASRSSVEGITIMLWAFGTWWVPLLLVFGLWRHVLRREPIAYDATWWSMVFPLGMYSAATLAVGRAASIHFMGGLAGAELWVAVAAWVAVGVVMLRAALRAARRAAAG